MRITLSTIAALCLAISCSQVDTTTTTPSSDNVRAIIVNEGQFSYGTGSLTALYEDGTYKNDLFRGVNSRPLGDVPQSIKRIGANYYIPVNNSNKVEVVDAATFKSVETMVLTHSTMPMYVEHLGADSIIVSDQSHMQANLMIMDINHCEKRDVLRRLIPMDCETFQMRVVGDKLFVVGSKHLSIFDMSNLVEGANRDIDIELANFTNIALDSQGMLWLLASNGVVCVDPEKERIVKSVAMSGIDTLWGSMDIDNEGKWLYFNVENKVYRVDTQSPVVPTEPFIIHNNDDADWTTYSLEVSPEGTIFIARVLFGSTTRGRIFEYNLDGTIASKYTIDGVEQPYFVAGIFPRGILFL